MEMNPEQVETPMQQEEEKEEEEEFVLISQHKATKQTTDIIRI